VVLAGVFDGIDELLAAADLLVVPAAEGDGSLAVLEAMAAGLPVVAGDIPGNRSLVTDGRHGLLVRVEDPPTLSGAIARLLDEPQLAARLGAEGRRRATTEFSLAKMVDAHVTLFESLIHAESQQSKP